MFTGRKKKKKKNIFSSRSNLPYYELSLRKDFHPIYLSTPVIRKIRATPRISRYATVGKKRDRQRVPSLEGAIISTSEHSDSTLGDRGLSFVFLVFFFRRVHSYGVGSVRRGSIPSAYVTYFRRPQPISPIGTNCSSLPRDATEKYERVRVRR